MQPPVSYHLVDVGGDGLVTAMEPMARSDIRINGGFFVLRREIFEHINLGEELVVEPFDRLMKQGKLEAAQCESFWAPMDTFKDKQRLDDMFSSGEAPWMVWNHR